MKEKKWEVIGKRKKPRNSENPDTWKTGITPDMMKRERDEYQEQLRELLIEERESGERGWIIKKEILVRLTQNDKTDEMIMKLINIQGFMKTKMYGSGKLLGNNISVDN